MKIILEQTSKIVHLDGVPARIWEGTTESGIPIHAYITRIAVDNDQNTAAFEAELLETKAPSPELQSIPLRLIL